MDGNGYLDAFLVPLNDVHRTLANDGHGPFTDQRACLGEGEVRSVALADLNGNGRFVSHLRGSYR